MSRGVVASFLYYDPNINPPAIISQPLQSQADGSHSNSKGAQWNWWKKWVTLIKYSLVLFIFPLNYELSIVYQPPLFLIYLPFHWLLSWPYFLPWVRKEVIEPFFKLYFAENNKVNLQDVGTIFLRAYMRISHHFYPTMPTLSGMPILSESVPNPKSPSVFS